MTKAVIACEVFLLSGLFFINIKIRYFFIIWKVDF